MRLLPGPFHTPQLSACAYLAIPLLSPHTIHGSSSGEARLIKACYTISLISYASLLLSFKAHSGCISFKKYLGPLGKNLICPLS